jgi:hypothetical protein
MKTQKLVEWQMSLWTRINAANRAKQKVLETLPILFAELDFI